MNSLPVRLFLNLIVPAALGAGAAWSLRSDGEGSAAVSAVPAAVRTDPSVSPAGAGQPSGFPVDHALAEQRLFCERLQSADLLRMMALLDEAQTSADYFLRRSLRNLVMQQMARTDPAASWVFLEKWEQGSFRNEFLQAWAQVDAAGALTWAEGQGKDAIVFAREIVAGLVPDYMKAFRKILPRLQRDQISPEAMNSACRLLAAADPAAAVQFLNGFDGGSNQNAATAALGEGWAGLDPNAAYAWAKGLTDPARRASALRGVLRKWAGTDPKAVAARLDELPKDPAMAYAAAGDSPLAAVVRAWARQDPKAAAAWLRTRPETADGRTFGKLLTSEILPAREHWNALEIVGLIRGPEEKALAEKGSSAFSGSGSSGHPTDDSFRWTVGKFGDFNSPFRGRGEALNNDSAFRVADPAGAFDDLTKLPADAARQEVLHEVAAQWVGQDPAAAAAKLRQLTDPWLRLGLVNAFAGKAHQNLDLDMAALVSDPDPKAFFSYPDMFFGAFYTKLAQNDPVRAEALLATDLSPDRKTQVANALVSQQAAYDPVGALGWAAQQTDAQVRQVAARSAMNTWAGADAYAASEWLAAQAAGPVREAAVEGLVGNLTQTSPEDALQWAGTLSDKSRRESHQIEVLRILMWRDEAKARELAAGLVLSEWGQRQLQVNFDTQAKSR